MPTDEAPGRSSDLTPTVDVPLPPTRVGSVDAMRGLTILLMVFVNDLGPAAPAWMHHIQPPDADGMTLADIVFPFFLFIAGVSIPLATEASRRRGISELKRLWHVVTRTLGLLVMGLVGVNLWSQTSTDPRLWGLVSYLAIIFAWVTVPPLQGRRRTLFLALKVLGAVTLILMLAVYRREPVDTEIIFFGEVKGWVWLQSQWWGILGLIGWAYLVASLVYLLLGSRREWLVGATALLMSCYVVSRSGGFFTRLDDKAWLGPLRGPLQWLQSLLSEVDSYVSISTQLGTLPAIVTGGCVLGTILLGNSELTTPRAKIRWALVYAGLLFVAGAVTDTFGGINKIAATPTWCLWCASLATLMWVALYWLMDVKKVESWAVAVRPAGANPLIAYLLHPILLFILGLTGLSQTLRSYAESPSAIVAVLGSVLMAAVVCFLTGVIAKAGVRVRV